MLRAVTPLMPMSTNPHTDSTELLMETINTLQEIESRMTARAYCGVFAPDTAPALRQVLRELLAVVDSSTSKVSGWI